MIYSTMMIKKISFHITKEELAQLSLSRDSVILISSQEEIILDQHLTQEYYKQERL